MKPIKDIMAYLHQLVEDADKSLEDKKNAFGQMYRKRFGIRGKKTVPWPDCANYDMRLADKLIRKAKPMYLGLVRGSGGDKVDIKVFGERDKALATKQAANWIVDYNCDGWEEEWAHATDKGMMFDWAFIAPYWKRELEQVDKEIDLSPFGAFAIENPETLQSPQFILQLAASMELDPEDADDMKVVAKAVQAIKDGKQSIKIKTEQAVVDKNAIRCVDPRNMIFFAGAKSIYDSEVLCELIPFTKRELYQAIKRGQFNRDVTQTLIDNGPDWKDSSDLESERNYREKRETSQGKSKTYYEIRKAYAWVEVEDGEYRRACVYYNKNFLDEPLSMQWYDRDEWPYVQVIFEDNEGGATSPRGIVNIVDMFSRQINTALNNMIDRKAITTTPIFTHIPSQVNVSSIRMKPGQSIPVKQHDAIKAINTGVMNADVSFTSEIMFIRAWAEEFVGISDFAITQPGIKGGNTPRTATEMQMIAANNTQSMNLDAMTFNRAIEKTVKFMLLDYIEHAPEELRIQVEGQEVRINKDDLLKNPVFKAVSTFESTNKELQTQKAWERTARILQTPNQDIYFNQYELRKQPLEAENDPNVMRLLRTPEEAAENVKQRSAQIAKAKEDEQIQAGRAVSTPQPQRA